MSASTSGRTDAGAGRPVSLWGPQTESARRMFAIGEDRMPVALIEAIALIKRDAARVNAEQGYLAQRVADAIAQAADEVLAGAHPDQFPLHVWQSGSGTQTNMNVNEVLATRASALLGDTRVHPNDDVNRGQSSNDVIPAAIQIAALRQWRDRLAPAIDEYRKTLRDLQQRHGEVLRLGRTHLQDALPVSLGQQIDSYLVQLDQAQRALDAARESLRRLGLGGTAVGTGVNAPPGFARAVVARIATSERLPLEQDASLLAETSAHGALLQAHHALALLAALLYKQANDIRWLASGPHGGLAELSLPANEPGSSIMPGKVNPTQAEALMMVCCQVQGNDAAAALAGTLGNFELNTGKPLLAHLLDHSTRLLSDALTHFSRYCVAGIAPDEQRMREHLESSLMMVTALAPLVGYDAAADYAKQARAERRPLREVVLASGRVTPQQYDERVDPRRLAGLPRAG